MKCQFIEGGEPVLKRLADELNNSVTNAGEYFSRLETSRDTRYCQWAGKRQDGRKGKGDLPWEGASDTSIRSADETVNEQVMVMLSAFWRTQIQAVGFGAENQMRTSQITDLLKWTVYVKMLPNLRRELQLAAQWRQDPGFAILSIEWDQRTRVEMKSLDMEELRAAAMEAQAMPEGEMLLDMADRFYDPLRESEAIEILTQLSPLVKTNNARRMLREIRTKGRTELPIPYFVTNQPRWVALRPYVDVFFRTEMDDLQDEPLITRVEYVSETTLRDRVVTMDYDEEFVTEALKFKGQSFQFSNFARQYEYTNERGKRGVLEERKHDIELLHAYYKSADEFGQPVLYYTVYNFGVSRSRIGADLYALHRPHGYDHGEYPFVPMTREHHTRRQADSRGVSEIAKPWQQEIKVQRDARSDYTQISVIPPLIIPPGRGGGEMSFGPGAQWPGRRGMNPEWAPVPPFNQSSIEMEKATERTLDRYFGRMSENVPAQLQQLHQQHLANGFLIELRMAFSQTFQLMQQFMDDAEVQQVVGRVQTPFRVGREEIQGKYDFFLDFDVRELDTEYVIEKLKAIQTVVLPFDRFGIFDMAKIAEFGLRALDPNLADIAVTSRESASEREIKEEQDALALMVSGQEAPMKLGNLNYQLRLDVLRNAVQSNPELQQMIMQRPLLQKQIEQRVKFLEQQIMQANNAVTGRLGAQPVLGPGI